jgi:hypothetical protein
MLHLDVSGLVIRDAISFERIRGYDELAKYVLVILPSISSSEQTNSSLIASLLVISLQWLN